MPDQFSRTELLLGRDAMDRLRGARVAVFGIGGVGGYVVEALARSGVGCLEIVDNDVISLTNVNRQVIALHSTIGRSKVEVMAERIRDINPDAKVIARECFFLPDNAGEFDFTSYDYVVDAVDTVTAKLAIIEHAQKAGVPVISSMGTGNKLDPSQFRVADIDKTSICPLARIIRKESRKRGLGHFKVVYSQEEAMEPVWPEGEEREQPSPGRRSIPGSAAFVPSAAGLLIASEVVRDLVGTDSDR